MLWQSVFARVLGRHLTFFKNVKITIFSWFICRISFHEITTIIFFSCRIHRHALWILGEYCENENDLVDVMDVIKTSLGEVVPQLFYSSIVSPVQYFTSEDGMVLR